MEESSLSTSLSITLPLLKNKSKQLKKGRVKLRAQEADNQLYLNQQEAKLVKNQRIGLKLRKESPFNSSRIIINYLLLKRLRKTEKKINLLVLIFTKHK